MLGKLLLALVVSVTARRWAVGLLVGLACVAGGRYLRANARDLSMDVVTTSSSTGSTVIYEKPRSAGATTQTQKVPNPERYDSLREDGLCLIVFGLAASVVSLAAWFWQLPAQPRAMPAVELPPSDY